MSRVRAKDTKPEMFVRRLVHGMGHRYRLHRKDLPGKPDLVFPARRKVIFVHGCFWHQHDCPKGSKLPRTRTRFWAEKLARNKKRDRENQQQLNENGWDFLVIWECETKNTEGIATTIRAFLSDT